MDSKEAKALTKALERNSVALEEHSKLLRAMLGQTKKPQSESKLRGIGQQASPFTGIYGG